MANELRLDLIHHWFYFLKISSSYQLVTRYKRGEISLPATAEQPHGFDLILKTYDDFGDVWSYENSNIWMGEKWLDLFNADRPEFRVNTIGNLLNGETGQNKTVQSQLKKYLEKDRVDLGCQPTLILAIPTNATKKDIMGEVAYAINSSKRGSDSTLIPKYINKPKYSCLINKIRKEELKNSRRIVICKANNPELTLWEIAIKLNINPSYSNKIKEAEQDLLNAKHAGNRLDKSRKATHEKLIINAIMGRYIRRTFLLSENAARGNFPSIAEQYGNDNTKVKTFFDYPKIQQLLLEQNKR